MEGTMAQWLAAAICLLFLAESAWRFEEMIKVAGTPSEKASALFNGVNFLLFALIGGLCLLWPHVSGWFESSQNKEESKEGDADKSKTDDNAAAIVEVVMDCGSMKALEVESKPKQPDAVKISIDEGDAKTDKSGNAPAKKSKLVYLQNLKAFLTFMVVLQHTLDSFTINGAEGIGTMTANPSFLTFSVFIMNANQYYFMAAFFLISAYFCPKSLDRKGFRAFVIDKMVRLGGPFILWTMLLGPLLYLWADAYAGNYPLHYNYNVGPPWFILWLLNFSIIYATVAQVLPSLHFKMPHPLLLLVLGLGLGGAFYGLSGVIGNYSCLGDMNLWTFGLCIYVPFFVAGIAGGRNDWLRENVENMATWVVWCLRITCVGFLLLNFLQFAQYTIPGLSSVHIDFNPADAYSGLSPDLWIPIYAIAMTLAMMQLFHQYLNSTFGKKWIASVGVSAYAVYVIHPWVMNVFIVIFIEILKAAKVPIVWDFVSKNPAYYTVGANGEMASMPEGYLWGGWIFVFVLTQLVVWPLAHYFRKLPVMNKMF